MKDRVTLIVNSDLTWISDIEKLQEALALCGVDVKVNSGSVTFEYDKDELARIRTRGAGRKTIMSGHTIGEVYLYSLEHTPAETAEYAGMSLRTYYRNVAKCKTANRWTDDETLLYFGLD